KPAAAGEGGRPASAGEGGKPASAGEDEKAAPGAAEAPAKLDRRPPAPTAESVPDMSPAVRPRDQSTKPDKSGVKDPTVGPQAAAGDQAPSRGKDNVVDINRGGPATRQAQPAPSDQSRDELPPAPAAPSVRRMARALGVDINDVQSSDPSGRISIEDVKAHTKRLVTGVAKSGGIAS